MMNNVSFDIETLGIAPGSTIISIGACLFDPITREVGATFYVNVDRYIQQDMGMTVSQSTIEWWTKQPQAAIDRTFVNPIDPPWALHMLQEWMPKDPVVWGYGANFDITLLEALYDCFNVEVPWLYSEVRCGRTLCNLADVWPERVENEHHQADADARRQAEAYVKASGKLCVVAG